MFNGTIFLSLHTIKIEPCILIHWQKVTSRFPKEVKHRERPTETAWKQHNHQPGDTERLKNLSTAEWLTNFKQWVQSHRYFVDMCNWNNTTLRFLERIPLISLCAILFLENYRNTRGSKQNICIIILVFKMQLEWS